MIFSTVEKRRRRCLHLLLILRLVVGTNGVKDNSEDRMSNVTQCISGDVNIQSGYSNKKLTVTQLHRALKRCITKKRATGDGNTARRQRSVTVAVWEVNSYQTKPPRESHVCPSIHAAK